MAATKYRNGILTGFLVRKSDRLEVQLERETLAHLIESDEKWENKMMILYQLTKTNTKCQQVLLRNLEKLSLFFPRSKCVKG